jgi:radical SAM protein with 4Fe4S-binding SPASM domain
MGNVKENSIEEIFNNQKYRDLRKQHTSLNIIDKVCKNCDSWYPEEKNQDTGEIVE